MWCRPFWFLRCPHAARRERSWTLKPGWHSLDAHCDWALYAQDIVKVWHKQNGVRTDHLRIARPQHSEDEKRYVLPITFSVKFFLMPNAFKHLIQCLIKAMVVIH